MGNGIDQSDPELGRRFLVWRNDVTAIIMRDIPINKIDSPHATISLLISPPRPHPPDESVGLRKKSVIDMGMAKMAKIV